MDKSFETSFIPQQPNINVGGNRRREVLNFPLVLSLVIFFVTLAVAGGVYLYHKQVVARVHAHELALEEAEKLLDIDEINQYKRIETRISIAKSLLADHNVFTGILNHLEESAAKNIGLTSLAYSRDKDNVILTLAGQAPNYEAVYFQSEVWRSMKPLVSSVVMSAVVLSGDTGVVSFTAKITLSEELLKYSRQLEAREQLRMKQEVSESNQVKPTFPVSIGVEAGGVIPIKSTP